MQTHETHPDHRCRACGCKLDYHRDNDNRCPPTLGWGEPVPFPSYKKTVYDTRVALDAYNAAIAGYWAGNSSTFNPR